MSAHTHTHTLSEYWILFFLFLSTRVVQTSNLEFALYENKPEENIEKAFKNIDMETRNKKI